MNFIDGVVVEFKFDYLIIWNLKTNKSNQILILIVWYASIYKNPELIKVAWGLCLGCCLIKCFNYTQFISTLFVRKMQIIL